MEHGPSELAAIIDMAIQDALTNDEYALMRERNKTLEYKDACASHDFCDTNHYACAAFEFLFNREPDLSNAADMGLLSDALDIASRVYWTAV